MTETLDSTLFLWERLNFVVTVKLLIDHLKLVESWFYTLLGQIYVSFALRLELNSPLKCAPSGSGISMENLRCLPSPSNFRL